MLFDFIDTLAARTMATVGKSVYGEKFTPYRNTASHSIEILREYNPSIKFVHLVRDGRDVIVSGTAQWLNHRLRNASPAEKPVYEDALSNHRIPPTEFAMFLDYWTDAVGAGIKARSIFPNSLDVTYEQLIADPFGQTIRLFNFLGLDSRPEVVRSCVDACTFAKLSGGRRQGEEDVRSFFRKGEVGDWKNWFTPEQESVFEQRAGELMSVMQRIHR